MANFVTLVPKALLYISIEYENGRNAGVTELSGVQFWSEIILVISNETRTVHSFDLKSHV